VDPSSEEIIVNLPVRNSGAKAIKFYLEPWAEEYVLEPGETIDIQARGPGGGALEVELGDAFVVVYCWVGATARLICKGAELGAGKWERARVPSAPEGMTVRGFADFMRERTQQEM
jgi:hypothetical protein